MKAPDICMYCDGQGNGPGVSCGFCVDGKPLDTQEDWDNSWGKTLEFLKPRCCGFGCICK